MARLYNKPGHPRLLFGAKHKTRLAAAERWIKSGDGHDAAIVNSDRE